MWRIMDNAGSSPVGSACTKIIYIEVLMDKEKFNEAVDLLADNIVAGDDPEVKMMIGTLKQYKRWKSVPSWYLLYVKALSKIKGLPEFEYEIPTQIGDFKVYYALNMNEVYKLGLNTDAAYLNFYSIDEESFIRSSANDYFKVHGYKFDIEDIDRIVLYKTYLWFAPKIHSVKEILSDELSKLPIDKEA
jgi:hypothetical protein